MAIEAFVFDIDDTLTATTKATRAARQRCLEFILEHLGVIPDEHTSEVERRLYEMFSWSRLPDMWRALATELGHEGLDDGAVKKLLSLFDHTFFHNFSLLPTVAETLTALRNDKTPIGIISDGDEALQKRKLRDTGIDKIFDPDRVIVTTQSDIYSSKPSTNNFKTMEKLIGLHGKRIAYIGDKPWDIAAANVAGWISVRTRQALANETDDWPNPALVVQVPDLEIRSLSEVLEWR